MKQAIKKTPLVGHFAKLIYRKFFHKAKPFKNTKDYWIELYKAGGNSGEGSYNKLADFKAEIINSFVKERNISTVLELGHGDGNQLSLADYPSYIGFDVSPHAVELCQKTFRLDKTKQFKLTSEYKDETAQLALSLDVIYHLVEDDVYSDYMERLFNSSEQFVIIYSSDFDAEQIHHQKWRRFSKWIESNRPDWKLIQKIPNKFPYNGNSEESSLSDFYIYEKS